MNSKGSIGLACRRTAARDAVETTVKRRIGNTLQFIANALGKHRLDCGSESYSPTVGITLAGLHSVCLQWNRRRNVQTYCNLAVESNSAGETLA